jgi:hypothetical protein
MAELTHVVYFLSDHEAQYLILSNVCNYHRNKTQSLRTGLIYNEALTYFQYILINKNWDKFYRKRYKHRV